MHKNDAPRHEAGAHQNQASAFHNAALSLTPEEASALSIADWTRRFASRGVRVGTLHEYKKRPDRSWLKGRPSARATANLELVEQRFSENRSNYLVVCGESLCVLDLDWYNVELNEALSLAADLFGAEFESAPIVQTASGGIHAYFSWDEHWAVKTRQSMLLSGVDFKGNRSYVVGPNSLIANKETGQLGRYVLVRSGTIGPPPGIFRDEAAVSLLESRLKACRSASQAGDGRRLALDNLAFTIGGLEATERIRSQLGDAMLGRVKAWMERSGCASTDLDSIASTARSKGSGHPLSRTTAPSSPEQDRCRKLVLQPAIVAAALMPAKGQAGGTDRKVLLAHLVAAHRAGSAQHRLSIRQCMELSGIAKHESVSAARQRLISAGALRRVASSDQWARGSGQKHAEAEAWEVLFTTEVHTLLTEVHTPLTEGTIPTRHGHSRGRSPRTPQLECALLSRFVFMLAHRVSHDVFRRSALGATGHSILCQLAAAEEPVALEALALAIGYRRVAGLLRSSSGQEGNLGHLIRLRQCNLIQQSVDGRWSLTFSSSEIDITLERALKGWDETRDPERTVGGKGRAQAGRFVAERSAFLGRTCESKIINLEADDVRWVG